MKSESERQHEYDLVKKFVETSDKDAFAEIYKLYIKDVYRFVYSRVGASSETEDIVSDTFATLYSILPNFNFTSKLSTFIFGISLNKVRQYFDKLKHKSEDFDIDLVISDDIYSEEEEENTYPFNETDLKSILNQLPDKEKKVLECRFIQNKNVKETAKECDLTESNVRVVQFRAIKAAVKIAGEYTKVKNNENKK